MIKIAAVICIAWASVASAQTLTTTVTDPPALSNAYWYEASNMTFADNSVAFGGSGQILCISPFLDSPTGTGDEHTYQVVNASSSIFEAAASASAVDRAMDLLHWTYDQYYADYFLGETIDISGSESFQYAIWELAADFNGTVSSLDLGEGNFYNGTDFPAVVQGIVNNFNAIAAGYRSEQYNIVLLDDLTPGATSGDYQSMVLVTPITPVPEPSSAILVGTVGFLLLLRRRSRA